MNIVTDQRIILARKSIVLGNKIRNNIHFANINTLS